MVWQLNDISEVARMTRSVKDGVDEAMRCWGLKFNCAESVMRGVCHAEDITLDDLSKKLATPFGGGIGRSEDVCGALTGGVLAIGASLGRTSPDQDKTRCYESAGTLYKQFEARFGATACKALNESDFTSPHHRVRCGRFVEEATRLTLEVLRKA
jgi:C_GCAxxG_C_C family probable redox protein